MIKKRLKKGFKLLPASIGLLIAASTAQGATTTQNMTVTATVAASCTFALTTLAFGSYTLAQLDGTSTITLTCTNGTPYEIALGAGNSPSATTINRRMTGPVVSTVAQYLGYGLYTDVNRTSNWGATTATDVSGTGTGAAVPITVYGRIPPGQPSAIGSYTDTIVVTVSY